MDTPYAIEMLHITKRFPGIVANDDITLQLRKGEIHALLGENGAGKSTLMSVLFGLYQAEEGEIRKDGKVVSIKNPNDANSLGIGMVHQHFKLVECFSVLDNIILACAVAEIVGFDSIPVKVTLDEYIEITKAYSSPKSGSFVNGVLDKAVAQLKENQQIRKTGRGLME